MHVGIGWGWRPVPGRAQHLGQETLAQREEDNWF